MGHARTTPKVNGYSAICFGVLLLAAAIALTAYFGQAVRKERHPGTLAQLTQLSPASLSQVSIEEMNLLCASGLSQSNRPNLKECRATLATWASHVASETERYRYRFKENPAEFENSSGFFRMLMLTVVLAEDYGVHYDPRRVSGPRDARIGDAFFGEPSCVFLDGLLGPDRVGTCSSLPVLYVAIGRRLGYPLELVTTKGHLFVRWEGQGERFNVEATTRGLVRFDDDYYRHWPFEIGLAEEAAEGYLKSLAPAEELATFLSIRGMCLREAGRLGQAAESFAGAVRLAPGCKSYRMMQGSLQAAVSQQSSTSRLQDPYPSQAHYKPHPN